MAKAKRRTRRKPQSKAGNSMWLWGVVGLAAVGGIFAYEHRREMPSMLAYAGVPGVRHTVQDAPVLVVKPKARPETVTPEQTASIEPVPPNVIPVALPTARAQITTAPETGGRFGLCGGDPSANCVIDGNTFRQDGIKIRLADIDVPDIDPAGCAGERQKATAARARLQALLNDGTFALSASGRGDDQYGNKYRIAMRAGRSIGDQLVTEGLARRATGQAGSWCS